MECHNLVWIKSKFNMEEAVRYEVKMMGLSIGTGLFLTFISRLMLFTTKPIYLIFYIVASLGIKADDRAYPDFEPIKFDLVRLGVDLSIIFICTAAEMYWIGVEKEKIVKPEDLMRIYETYICLFAIIFISTIRCYTNLMTCFLKFFTSLRF